MQVHPLNEEENRQLRAVEDRTPMTASLQAGNQAVARDEPLSEETLKALASATPALLHFTLQTMGVRIGQATCVPSKPGGEDRVRWDLQFEASLMDRFASAFRHKDWRHGLIGSALRAIWTAGEALNLEERAPELEALLHPSEFTAVRWDGSREKEKDRAKDVPLVNLSASGGGGTPLKRPPLKAGAKAKKR
jgi:hypothetical protein